MSAATAETNGTTELATQAVAKAPDASQTNPLASVSGDEFANLMDVARFNHLWRVSVLFSKTALVPEHFRNKPEDCFVATSMAMRLGIDPLMLMQNTYIVHGKPGMEAKLVIALVNTSGMFEGGIQYERDGGEAKNANFRVRAYAVRRSTGEIVHGPWVDWATVRAEGLESKAGSKWKTIPDLMFAYRAATWFARLHCPERLMGMQTSDELEDIGDREPFEPKAVRSRSEMVADALAKTEPNLLSSNTPEKPSEPPASDDKQSAATKAKTKTPAAEKDTDRQAREDWERLNGDAKS